MKLTGAQLYEIIGLKEQGLSGRKIAVRYGKHQSIINRFLNKSTHSKFWDEYTGLPLSAGTLERPQERRAKAAGKAFILTSAQNNSKVHEGFLSSLEVMAKHRQAEIMVGCFAYNKKGFQKLEKDGEWYDPLIQPYMNNKSVTLAKKLVWCGELNILPTAVNPISGLQTYTGTSSSVFPHVKVNLESVPTHKFDNTKMVYTTGCITQANYIKKKEGQKAEFHHIYGALFVEVDKDGTWFARHIIANSKTGEFQDLGDKYTPTGVTSGHSVEAINWGDIHLEKLDDVAGKISFGVGKEDEEGMPYPAKGLSGNMLDDLMPRHCFYHDLIDFKVRNHHNRKNPLFKVKMMYEETESVRYGQQQSAKFLDLVERPWCTNHVVNSNHDAALQKWAVECRWEDDPVNAEFLLQCQLSLVQAVKRNDNNFCIFEDTLRTEMQTTSVHFLRLDESFKICGDNGIECGFHGHTGNNGARGSTQSYRLSGSRFNIGHQHSAGIKDGVYVAGVTGKLDMGYNVGMGGWSHSHIVTYENAKRAIITLRGNRYKAIHHFIDNQWIKA